MKSPVPAADTCLQVIIPEAEPMALPSGTSDDRLRFHHVLGMNFHWLGDYRQALSHRPRG